MTAKNIIPFLKELNSKELLKLSNEIQSRIKPPKKHCKIERELKKFLQPPNKI